MSSPAQPDSRLAESILRTLIYADVFNFPMTSAELHHFLMSDVYSPEQIEAALQQSSWLGERTVEVEGYYALRERAAIIAERAERGRASDYLWPTALRYGVLLGYVPFVRMVALTGALAMHNAHRPDDDIDYLIVTRAGRVWLTRALIVLIVRLARLRGAEICPNYVLSESALAQDRRDLYMAHEVTQMVPLFGGKTYRALRAANRWTEDYLPAALGPFYAPAESDQVWLGRAVKRAGSVLFGGWLGNWLEGWERRRKLRKFERQSSRPHSSAQLDSDHVKGHFNDYGYPTLQKYQERLVEYGLSKFTPEEFLGLTDHKPPPPSPSLGRGFLLGLPIFGVLALAALLVFVVAGMIGWSGGARILMALCAGPIVGFIGIGLFWIVFKPKIV